MPTASLFGIFLRAYRNRARLSRSALAASLHVAPEVISRLETGRENPPGDPLLYEQLRLVPGFTDAAINLLWGAAEADKSSEDLENLRVEAAKANEDLTTLLAQISTHQAMLAELSNDVLALFLSERGQALPEELQAYSQLIAQSFIETMTMYSELGLAAIAQLTMQATQVAPTPVEVEEVLEETQEPPPESFTDTEDSGIISSPMPTKEGENGSSFPEHISDLQSHARLGSETNQQDEQAKAIRQHVEQLREEAKIPQGILIYQRGTLPKNYERHAKQLVEGLGNQQHSLRKPVERSLRGFAVAAEKGKGISASSAAREFNAPTTFFLRWAKQFGVIPILVEGRGAGSATILDREKAREAANIYHEAKLRKIQPKKLLERMSSPQAPAPKL